jgi:hypothetical protein
MAGLSQYAHLLGYVVHVWTPRVTKVDPAYLDCSVYLYPSEADARDGRDAGGSGFLVSMPSKVHAGHVHIFVVTNKHVVEGKITEGIEPAQVIRLTTPRHTTDVIDLSDRWIKSTNDDLAVGLLHATELEPYKYDPVPVDRFVTEADLADRNHVHIGTPCFMVGRFLNAGGQQRNTPAVRFGDLSILSCDMVDTGESELEGVFIVEMHSIGGFSGSPVFTYPHFAGPGGIGHQLSKLLGVDRGHTLKKELVKKQGELVAGHYVTVNSGGAIVVPAWRLLALLSGPKAAESRRQEDIRATETRENPTCADRTIDV